MECVGRINVDQFVYVRVLWVCKLILGDSELNVIEPP